MRVTVSIEGRTDREVDAEEATYGDLVEAVGLSRQEAVVLVDGRPVPEDAAVDADHVEVVRLIAGG